MTNPTAAAREWREKHAEEFRTREKHVVTDFTDYYTGGYIDIDAMMEAYAASRQSSTVHSLTPGDYVLAAQNVLTYLNRECAHPPAGLALENEVGRIICKTLEGR